MTDLKEFPLPFEVFEAALGNPAPLAALLRSDEHITELTRFALALHIEGRLKLPKGKPGRKHKYNSLAERAFSPFEFAVRRMQDDDMQKGETAEEAATAEAGNGATKDQILDYLNKSELPPGGDPKNYRPRPPERPAGGEEWLLSELSRYHRQTRKKRSD